MLKSRRKKLYDGVKIPQTELPDDEPQNFCRVGMTPNIFDLEEALKLLSKGDPLNVAMCRAQLKWLMKECNKSFGVQFRHPYRGGDHKA
jgi:hypothetical protein